MDEAQQHLISGISSVSRVGRGWALEGDQNCESIHTYIHTCAANAMHGALCFACTTHTTSTVYQVMAGWARTAAVQASSHRWPVPSRLLTCKPFHTKKQKGGQPYHYRGNLHYVMSVNPSGHRTYPIANVRPTVQCLWRLPFGTTRTTRRHKTLVAVNT